MQRDVVSVRRHVELEEIVLSVQSYAGRATGQRCCRWYEVVVQNQFDVTSPSFAAFRWHCHFDRHDMTSVHNDFISTESSAEEEDGEQPGREQLWKVG